MEFIMNIAKTLSTLSLAFALQGGALVAAAVVLSPSDAAAVGMKKPKQDPRKQFKDSRKCIPSRTKVCLH
jgi:hypothetical protein